MIISLFVITFVVGIGFGYMIFNDSPANYDYEVKIGSNIYRLEVKLKKTEIWNAYDGDGNIKYTYIQLKEKAK